MFRNRPVSLALVGLFVWVTGCQTYTQIEIGEVADHGKVRVTLTDGERETIRDPRVEADSIKGLGKMVGGGSSDRVPLSISLDQVTMLESGEHDQGETAWLVVGVLVGIAAAVFTVALINYGNSNILEDL